VEGVAKVYEAVRAGDEPAGDEPHSLTEATD
jgi:hypothetical protein